MPEIVDYTALNSRIPHGMRGLKLLEEIEKEKARQSHPAWDAWIEIGSAYRLKFKDCRSHPAWDAWIEMLVAACISDVLCRSHPAWDAWIEIGSAYRLKFKDCRSHPAWDAWIEILGYILLNHLSPSHPAWDAWIEIRR